jgi:hypothetical protein
VIFITLPEGYVYRADPPIPQACRGVAQRTKTGPQCFPFLFPWLLALLLFPPLRRGVGAGPYDFRLVERVYSSERPEAASLAASPCHGEVLTKSEVQSSDDDGSHIPPGSRPLPSGFRLVEQVYSSERPEAKIEALVCRFFIPKSLIQSILVLKTTILGLKTPVSGMFINRYQDHTLARPQGPT